MVDVASRPGTGGPAEGTERPRGPRRTWHPGTGIAVVALVVLAVCFLAAAWHPFWAVLGLNHDGQNAGLFAMGSRAIREDGLVASRLGSHLALGHGVYANHPPLIYPLIALSETLFGVHPASLRLPFLVVSVAMVPLLFRTLRRLGIGTVGAVAGTVVALGTPMFFVYSAMPDTPMLALPLAVGMLGAWIDAEEGRGGTALPVWTLAACLAGWEAVLMAAVLLLAGLVRSRRSTAGTQDRRHLRRMGVMIATAVGVTFAWVWWAYGSFEVIWQQLLRRSGNEDTPFGPGQALSTQSRHLMENFGPLVLALGTVGLWLALRRPSSRAVTALVCTVVVGYAVVFWQAATYHDYWHYWLLLPVAIGVATLADHIVAAIPRAAPAVLAAATLVPLSTLALGSSPATAFDAGTQASSILSADQLPADQPAVLAMGIGDPTGWMSYTTGRPVRRVAITEVDALAREHPAWRVLILCRSPRSDGGPPICSRLGGPQRGGLALPTTAAVAEALSVS